MGLHQTIAWIEENQARILRVDKGLHHEPTIVARGPPIPAESLASRESVLENDAGYFQRVARALDTADEILVVGPCAIKLEFVKYMHKNDHAFDPRILGVETVDNPNDARLEGYAKLYFTEGGPRRAGNGSGHKTTD